MSQSSSIGEKNDKHLLFLMVMLNIKISFFTGSTIEAIINLATGLLEELDVPQASASLFKFQTVAGQLFTKSSLTMCAHIQKFFTDGWAAYELLENIPGKKYDQKFTVII
jgi:hypothetical protein